MNAWSVSPLAESVPDQIPAAEALVGVLEVSEAPKLLPLQPAEANARDTTPKAT
jgi:hypothetical protein